VARRYFHRFILPIMKSTKDLKKQVQRAHQKHFRQLH
jgi:hypothetical protein